MRTDRKVIFFLYKPTKFRERKREKEEGNMTKRERERE
jgi:hypothetical protein